MDEIKFLYDDTEEKKLKHLDKIIDLLSKKRASKQIYASKRFIFALLLATKLMKRRQAEKNILGQPIEKKIEKKKEAFQTSVISPPTPSKKLLKQAPKPPEKVMEEKRRKDIIDKFKGNYPLVLAKTEKGEVLAQGNIVYTTNKAKYIVTEQDVDADLLNNLNGLVAKKFSKKSKFISDIPFVLKNLKKACKNINIPFKEEILPRMIYMLNRDLIGFGKIDVLVRDTNISSISCGGVSKPVTVSYGYAFELESNVVFENAPEFNFFIKSLAKKIGKDISENDPVVEGTYKNLKIQLTLGIGDISSKFIIQRI